MTLGREILRPADVVDVVRVAAVDDDVVLLQVGREGWSRVVSTTPAGTMIHTARGAFILLGMSASVSASTAPAFTRSLAASGCVSKTTHS